MDNRKEVELPTEYVTCTLSVPLWSDSKLFDNAVAKEVISAILKLNDYWEEKYGQEPTSQTTE